jgi:hypothetical protein
MGVKQRMRLFDIVDNEVDDLLISTQYFPSSSGAWPVLSMGVAPEAIVKKKSWI